MGDRQSSSNQQNATAFLQVNSPGAQHVVFHITGFGKFQGVSHNPTTTLMDELPEYLNANNSKVFV